MRINTTITTIVLFSLTLLSFSSFAATCIELKECPEPVKKLQQLAERKAPEAQLIVGMLYRHNMFYQGNEQEAFKWIKRAARQQPQYAFAQHLLGKAYLYGEGVEVNRDRAVRYLKRSAKLGLLDSQRILGKEYGSGKVLEKDLEKAKMWLEAAAKQRDFSATIKLVQLLRKSDDRDDIRAAEYWATESQSMRVNVRDISERIELDMALIEKVVERSELWVRGKLPIDSHCRDENGDYKFGCVEANNFPRLTQSYHQILNSSQAFNH